MNNERVIELFHEFREAYVGLDSVTGRALLPNFADQLYEPMGQAAASISPQGAGHGPKEIQRLDFTAIPFCSLLEAHPQDLTNGVNQFSEYIDQLRAWQQVISPLDMQERLDAVSQLIYPLAHFCLGSPYALHQRFCTSITQLSYQANRFVSDGWCDNKRLEKPNFNTARAEASHWSTWPGLENQLAALNDSNFQARVYDFRKQSQHGFPRQLEVGHTPFVRREAPVKEVVYDFGTFFRPEGFMYTFGAAPPLLLADVLLALVQQCQAALAVHQAYMDLLKEQLSVVIAKCGVDGE